MADRPHAADANKPWLEGGVRASRDERLEAESVDPDLGRLELWRVVLSQASYDLVEWRGTLPGSDLPLSIPVEDDPAAQLRWLNADVRATLRRLAAREPDLRTEVAARLHCTACDWSDDASLTAEALSHLLGASSIAIWADEVDVNVEIYFDEHGGIFGDHTIVCMLGQQGEIINVGIEG